MTTLATIPVPGTDRQIMATLVGGKPMVSLRHACEAIGLATDSQRRKLRSRSWAVVTQEVSTGSDGKSYEMTMIDRRTFTYWLGGLDITSPMNTCRAGRSLTWPDPCPLARPGSSHLRRPAAMLAIARPGWRVRLVDWHWDVLSVALRL